MRCIENTTQSQPAVTTVSLTWQGGPGAGRCQTPRRPPRRTGRSRASRVQVPAEWRARVSAAPHDDVRPAQSDTLTLCAAPLCCATRLVFLQRCVADSSATRIWPSRAHMAKVESPLCGRNLACPCKRWWGNRKSENRAQLKTLVSFGRILTIRFLFFPIHCDYLCQGSPDTIFTSDTIPILQPNICRYWHQYDISTLHQETRLKRDRIIVSKFVSRITTNCVGGWNTHTQFRAGAAFYLRAYIGDFRWRLIESCNRFLCDIRYLISTVKIGSGQPKSLLLFSNFKQRATLHSALCSDLQVQMSV